MPRYFCAPAALAAAILLPDARSAEPQAPQEWATLKGRIVWGDQQIPQRKPVAVTRDIAHCLQANPTADAAKKTILDECLLVSSKNKGIKNVFVYLIVARDGQIPIHPDLNKFEKEVVVDQPACMFWPRAIALRQGQTLVVKNSAPVDHSFRYIGDGVDNQGGSVLIKAGQQAEIKDLSAQRLPLPVECNLHGWMKGRIGVFNHPYFAVTNEDGAFEIKNVAAGHHKLMVYHEEIGYRLGKKGKDGEAVVINAGGTDLGELTMGGR
jgi:hypothetical protein